MNNNNKNKNNNKKQRKNNKSPKLCLGELIRYDYNLAIMKSPKPATDNRFKK